MASVLVAVRKPVDHAMYSSGCAGGTVVVVVVGTGSVGPTVVGVAPGTVGCVAPGSVEGIALGTVGFDSPGAIDPAAEPERGRVVVVDEDAEPRRVGDTASIVVVLRCRVCP
jgi:hypothetical protein